MSEYMQLNINVKASDAAEFLQLVANYLRDPIHVIKDMRALNTRYVKEQYLSMEESTPSPKEKSEKVSTDLAKTPPKRTLYQVVVEDCVCGMCYTKLLRDDKVPWRSDGINGFISAKHGTYKPGRCPVGRFTGMGFIYRQPGQRKLELQIQQEQIKQKIAEQKIGLNKVKMERRKVEINEKEATNRIAGQKIIENYTSKIAEYEKLQELSDQEFKEHTDLINSITDSIYKKKNRKPDDLSYKIKDKTYRAPSLQFFSDRDQVFKEVKRRYGPFRFSQSRELKTLKLLLQT